MQSNWCHPRSDVASGAIGATHFLMLLMGRAIGATHVLMLLRRAIGATHVLMLLRRAIGATHVLMLLRFVAGTYLPASSHRENQPNDLATVEIGWSESAALNTTNSS